MRCDGLHLDAISIHVGSEKEKAKGSLRRTSLDRPVFLYLLVRRDVHHVQLRLLA